MDVVSDVPASRHDWRRIERHQWSVGGSRRQEPASAVSGRPAAAASVVRDLLVLPPACSLLARVTAMHNYSSTCTGRYTSLSLSSSAAAGVYSAPQSPSVFTDMPPLRHRLDRRCISTPASPSPPLYNSTSPTATAVRRSRRRVPRRRRQRACTGPAWESSGSDDSDCGQQHPAAGGGGKRAHHNVLERRRRDNLKYSFEALRAVVPGTPTDGRVPKVMILRRARDHVRHLTSASQRLFAEYARLRSLHQRWTHKLALLAESDQLPSLHAAGQNVRSAVEAAA